MKSREKFEYQKGGVWSNRFLLDSLSPVGLFRGHMGKHLAHVRALPGFSVVGVVVESLHWTIARCNSNTTRFEDTLSFCRISFLAGRVSMATCGLHLVLDGQEVTEMSSPFPKSHSISLWGFMNLYS